MNQAELPEVASCAGITQGTNSVNLHAVLCSTADKNMVYFVHCKTLPPILFIIKFRKQNKKCYCATSVSLSAGTVSLCKPTKNKEFCGGFDMALAVGPIRNNTFGIN